ncbi:hypothetical protein [Flyfo siphovirus Tbat1_6]|uniref:hypothetical protein n=1 Tax=Flyfo siphovirus Tbat1_6 TaxID=2907287 RepID=UPI00233EBF95|nr:hypothetical protein PRB80_gp49 [Flyfo siphovirus Tbat1_6]UIW10244.1 hypothetical protein [Flyfo siphovirus Tbat1_6]
MKKFIVVAVFAMASFGASAGVLCNAIGEVGKAAAEARDAGVPKQIALAVSVSSKASDGANQINKTTVEAAYQMTNKTPKEMFVIARDICISTFGNN